MTGYPPIIEDDETPEDVDRAQIDDHITELENRVGTIEDALRAVKLLPELPPEDHDDKS